LEVHHEVARNDMEIVSVLRATLADRVGQQRFELWFGPQTRLSVHAGGILVEVPTQFMQDWLRTQFRKELETACIVAMGKPLPLEFRIDPTLGGKGPAESITESITETVPFSGGACPAVSESAPTPLAPERPTRRRFASLCQFVVGPCNRVAHASAQMTIERLGRMSPLFLHGPTGVGKTHLLEGIWTAAKKAAKPAHAVYLSAEQFTTYFLEALRGSGLPSFRRKYRGVELLLVDDVQFFMGKRATLVELLHTIDTLTREGRQIVLAADRPVTELSELGPELGSRLTGGMVCGLERPDQPTRVGIARQMASKLEVTVPDDVLEYVATHLTSHARELSGALNRLQATSQALSRPITRALAEEALTDMIRTSGRVVRLADVERAVCDVLGLEAQSLQADGKSKSVSYPRMLAMFLARKHTRAALTEIGRYFGRRSHSTVISAEKSVGRWMQTHGTIELAGKDWNVEEAIRRVEQNLKQA
jgi:chromosomal replication initiator protein